MDLDDIARDDPGFFLLKLKNNSKNVLFLKINHLSLYHTKKQKQTMETLTVANEIRNQIGNKALYMLGAYNLAGDASSLTFRIRGSRKANCIKIELTSMDTYNVTFYKIGSASCKEVSNFEGAYSDMLHNIIEKRTGLYTSL